MVLRPFAFAVAVSMLMASVSPAAPYKILAFSKTAGFRHASIPDGLQCLRRLGTNNNFNVDATENAAVFTFDNLRQYRAVVFLLTTGDVLDSTQQAAFESYIRVGGGYVGVHSASDTEYSWPWYGQLVGAYFQNHPANQTATVRVADHVHPATAHLPDLWVRFDEWYNFPTNNHPRGRVHVLATLDERTYAPGSGAMGFDHPIAWCHEFDGGRSFYTAGGHTSESYSEPHFQQHLLGGIEWAARVKDGDAGATSEVNFRKVILDATPSNPMELAVAPDGRVFYIERAGRLKIYLPSQNQTVIAGMLSVDMGLARNLEDGLLGLALDPGFETNQWIYLFYSPAGTAAKQHVSRFTMSGNLMDPGSERILMEIPTQRSECCHSAGSLAFGPDGNLYIATGDNTNPFASNGYAPIDERAGRSAWDAQKSSSNMNDLRGKILRVRPQADGTYTIPAGNLFSAGVGRPEIYVMGCRNPFRISVDQRRGWLYWGDVGPDANTANASRGPAGHDEWNQARSPGNYGWPYFVGDNKAYVEYDFATFTSLAAYNPNAPTNNSPNNTGGQLLPPARPAWIWYPYGNSVEFPEVSGGGSRTAMAGPVYYYSNNLVSSRKLPAYYDRTLFIYEWSRNWLREVKLDTSGNILKINPFLPNFQFLRPMDLELGPDGALYLIEWGTTFNGDNADARIVRIEYLPGQVERAPTLVTLVPTGATWNYRDDGSNQGTGWIVSGFNDGSWKSGVGKFGTNDPANTRIEIGPANNRWITTYFRHRFNVTNFSSITGLVFNVLRDDGVVVYLNEQEVFRMNMPAGNVNYLTGASTVVSGADESRFYSTNISPAHLRTGTNLLAVELHQSGTNTTDAGFELSLAGAIPRNIHPPISFQRSGENLVLTWRAINFALEATENLNGAWADIPLTAPGSYTVPTATGNRFFRLRRYP
jgi:cytochrome c